MVALSDESSLSLPVLVLNRGYQPVRVTSARDALAMLFVGRAFALDASYEPHTFDAWVANGSGDHAIGTTQGALFLPRVILLKIYSRVPRTPLRLSRRNLLLRDSYTCQYCARTPSVRDLNLDHVMPRSRGGGTTWENLVVSCRRCNLDKGNRTPREAGLRLLKTPKRPTWSVLVQLVGTKSVPQWEPFLGGVELPAALS